MGFSHPPAIFWIGSFLSVAWIAYVSYRSFPYPSLADYDAAEAIESLIKGFIGAGTVFTMTMVASNLLMTAS
jgi:hypothetical protein